MNESFSVNPSTPPKLIFLLRVVIALVLFFGFWGVLLPQFGGSHQADRSITLLMVDGEPRVLSKGEEQIVAHSNAFSDLAIASCWFKHDYQPGLFLPIFEVKSTSILIQLFNQSKDPIVKQLCEEAATETLLQDPEAAQFRPGLPVKRKIAWIPMLIFGLAFSLWWWLSFHLGAWLAEFFHEFFLIRPRLFNNQCLRCGYSCKDITTGICPECGKPHVQTEGSNA